MEWDYISRVSIGFALFLQGIICYNEYMGVGTALVRGGMKWKLYD
mgnify:CR=1 FL=1